MLLQFVFLLFQHLYTNPNSPSNPKEKKTVFFLCLQHATLVFSSLEKAKKKQLKVGGRHFNFHHFHANPKGRVELFLGALLMPATPSLFS